MKSLPDILVMVTDSWKAGDLTGAAGGDGESIQLPSQRCCSRALFEADSLETER